MEEYPHNINIIEEETLSDRWEQIILDSGYSGVISVFPKGEFVIGGSRIKIEQPGRYESHIIHDSNSPPAPTEDTFGYLYGVLESASVKRFPNTDKPMNMAILAVDNLEGVANSIPSDVSYKENLKDICRSMFGAVYETSCRDGSGIEVAHVILLPKDLQKNFIQDCLTDPKFCKELTEKLLTGVDKVLPRQQPDSIMVFVNKKEKVKKLLKD